MTVRELILQLQAIGNQDSLVFIEYEGQAKCDTCGYGSDKEAAIIGAISSVDDLEDKVWLKKEDIVEKE